MNNIFFETIKIDNGKIYNLDYHILRMKRTVEKSYDKLNELDIEKLIDIPKKGLFKSKLIYDNEIRKVEIMPYTPRKLKSFKLVESNDFNYSFKYLERDGIDSLFKLRENCDEIIIVKNGDITDTSIANLAFFDGRKWFTPKRPLLEGTMKRKLIDEGKIFEKEIDIHELKMYNQVAVMNAMIDFKIIGSLNDVIK